MVSVEIKLSGTKELERKLKSLDKKRLARAAHGSLRSAANIVLKEARERARPRARLFKKAMQERMDEADLVYLALVAEQSGQKRKYKDAPRTKAVKHHGEYITAPQELYDEMVKIDKQIIGDSDAPKASRGRRRATALEKGIVARVRVNQNEETAYIGLSKELLSGGRRKMVYTYKLNRLGFMKTFGTLREPARPFLEPALDAKEKEAVEGYRKYLSNWFEKQGI